MTKRSGAEEPIRAVEMVRRIRDAHYERFRGRPVEERLAYYREQARAFERGGEGAASRERKGAA